MSKEKTIVLSIAATLAVILLFFFTVFFQFFVPVNLSHTKIFQIKDGQSVQSIAMSLKKQGIIRSTFFFRAYVKLKNSDTFIRSGYFYMPQRMNLPKVLDILTTSSGVYHIEKITIPEGFSVMQIAARLEANGICSANVFHDYVKHHAKADFNEQYPFLNFKAAFSTIEGYLFPETYFFRQNESVKTIVSAMLGQFSNQIYRYYETANYAGHLSFHELVTMASLIEKESRVRSEMPLISSVFHNRLARTIRLRTDPTVVYALGLSYKKRVYYKDLEVDSPYNTYKNVGLPPTAIASPGLEAFKAACFPAKSSYLFFVARPDGKHDFTKTYQEHLKVQRKR